MTQNQTEQPRTANQMDQRQTEHQPQMTNKPRTGAAVRWVWLGLAVLVVVLDQFTKHWVVQSIADGERIVLLPVLNFIKAYNTGAAYNLLGGGSGWQIYLLAGVSIAVSLVVLIAVWRTRLLSVWCGLGYALILGGAVGNLIDRVRLHYVVDFVDFHIGSWHFATFNLADAAITFGAIALLIQYVIIVRSPASS